MEHVKWAVMAVHHNMEEAREKIMKAYKMRTDNKELADWQRDMAVAHINFNNAGVRLAQEQIERARHDHDGNERHMGMLDVWEGWLHEIVGETAEVKAIIDSYK